MNETFKRVLVYVHTNPDVEKGEKWFDSFYADLYRVRKDDIPSRNVSYHTLILIDFKTRISKEQLIEARLPDGAWTADYETKMMKG